MDIQSLINKTKEEVEALAKENNQLTRVLGIDKEEFMGTMDYNPNRINIWLVNNLVVKATLG